MIELARERDRADWWRQSKALSHLTGVITGEKIEPMELMPESLKWDVPEVAKTPAQEQRETHCALTLLGQALGDC